MRCYLMKYGQIHNVAFLTEGSSDERLILEAEIKFRELGGTQNYDGFEVWVGKRFVYRYPLKAAEQQP